MLVGERDGVLVSVCGVGRMFYENVLEYSCKDVREVRWCDTSDERR